MKSIFLFNCDGLQAAVLAEDSVSAQQILSAHSETFSIDRKLCDTEPAKTDLKPYQISENFRWCYPHEFYPIDRSCGPATITPDIIKSTGNIPESFDRSATKPMEFPKLHKMEEIDPNMKEFDYKGHCIWVNG